MPGAEEPGRWLPIVVDLAHPVAEVTTCGAVALHVTALWRGQPLGTLVIPVDGRADEYPAARLAAAVHGAFADAAAAADADESSGRPVAPAVHSGSVVVCTRNRFASLQRCLTSLVELEAVAADRVIEVVVVDNGDGDGATRRMVEGLGFRWVHEPLPGLDRARNRGLLEARGDVVLYTDDDVVVSPTWADELLRCFDDPLVGVATGLVLPAVLDSPYQRTFEEHAGFSRGMHRRELDGARQQPTKAGALGAGASMAFRRSLMRALGGFPEALDAGMPTKTGGDTYGIYRVLRAGYAGVYQPRALAFHWHRDGPDELVKTLTGYSTGTYSFLGYAALRDGDLQAVRAMAAWTRVWLGRRLLGALARRADAPPLQLAWAEVVGAAATPRALRAALRLVHERGELRVGSEAGPAERPPPVAGPVGDPDGRPSLTVVVDARGLRDSAALLSALGHQAAWPEQVVIVVDGPGAVAGAPAGIDVDIVRVPQGSTTAVALNAAAGAAWADVLLFLDGDIALLADDLLVAHLHEHAERTQPVAVVGPRLPAPVPETAYALTVRNSWVEQATRLRAGEVRPQDVVTSNLSLPRAGFLAAGGWRDLPGREAWELGCRLREHGVSLVAAPSGALVARAEVDLAAALDRLEETGRTDVLLAQEHPGLVQHLPLGEWREFGPRRKALVRAVFRCPGMSTWLSVLRPALVWQVSRVEGVVGREMAHRCRSFAEFVAYWSGVRHAMSSLDQLSDSLAAPRPSPGPGLTS